ncbi:biotin/lipoyl-binding protein, partial [Acinetobacter baumannii]
MVEFVPDTVTIKPRVSGQILDLAFVEGQELQQGAVVAHIDPRPCGCAPAGAGQY